MNNHVTTPRVEVTIGVRWNVDLPAYRNCSAFIKKNAIQEF